MKDQAGSPTGLDEASLWRCILTDSFEEIYVFDAETLKFLQVSRGALDNLGYSMAEMLSLTAADIKPDLTRVEFLALIEPLKRNEEDLLVFETRHRRKDGSFYPVEVRLQLASELSPPVFIAIILDRTERERSLRQLRQGEARLAEAQRITHVGSWELDLDTEQLIWSDEVFRIFEIDKKAFGASYQAFLDAIHPDDRQLVNDAYLNSLETRQPYEIDHRLLMKDGRVKYVQERCETTFDDMGRPLRSMGTIQDISKRKRAEAAARENEQRFQLLAQISPAGIYLTDAQGLCTYVNERWQEMGGMSEAQALGTGWVNAIHPDDRDMVFREWQRAAETQTPFYIECRFLQPSADESTGGKVIWVLTQASAERDIDGNVTGYVGVVTDISQQKRIELALSEIAAAGTGASFFQHLVQGLVKLFDAQAAFVCRLVPGAEDQTENLALGFNDKKGGEARGEIRCCDLQDSPCSETISSRSLFTVRQGLNERFPQNICALTLAENAESFIGTPLLGSDGEVTGIMGIVNDEPLDDIAMLQPILEMFAARAVAELERQKADQAIRNQRDELERQVAERTAELSASNHELEAFAYSVSHDLRAPLRAIDGFSLALLEDYGDSLDETGGRYLQRVRAGTQRMGDLIDDMLQLSRVNRGDFNLQQIDISAMAEEVFQRLQATAPERQVKIDVMPGMNAQGDRRLLGILLENLLGNAWKYTGKQDDAQISFACTRQGDERIFYVRDNGVGFNPQYTDKVFEAFQRLHSSSEFEGSGVGLATVQRVVKRHGGRVWAEAEEGEGATFYFTLG